MRASLLFVWSILIFAGILTIYFRPLLPVDETRYMSVAWEMFNSNSYIVPVLNSHPYHHKPPLLFWITIGIWKIFGIGEAARIINSFFGCGVVLISSLIYKELWKENSSLLALIVGSGFLFFVFSALYNFDVMLAFWSLLAILFFAKALDANNMRHFVFAGISVGFGILAKGPVVLIHTLVFGAILPFVWKREKKRWFKGILASVLIGATIALLWALPAAIIGGEEYAKAIFWKQSAGRIASSFAHKKPFWWYFPMLFVLFSPYILHKEFLKNFFKNMKDKSFLWLVFGILITVFIFSFISGKQIQYLLPEGIIFSVLVARVLEKSQKEFNNDWMWAIYMGFGIAFLTASLWILFKKKPDIESNYILLMGLVFLAMGFALKTFSYPNKEITIYSILFATFLFYITVLIGLKDVWSRYDLKSPSNMIAKFQEENKTIAVIGKYYGEFHFLGRLKKPIKVLPYEKKAQLDFFKKHPEAIIVLRQKNIPSRFLSVFPYRNKKLVFIKAKDLRTNF
jgi:4-amino-4-deoxy-L-arabinose transferase-like glycosyltransferase